MNIFRGNKIEIDYNSYDREFTLSIYDNYGHYIDSMKMDKDEMGLLYKSLDEIKNIF
jgi:hypothetical protein